MYNFVWKLDFFFPTKFETVPPGLNSSTTRKIVAYFGSNVRHTFHAWNNSDFKEGVKKHKIYYRRKDLIVQHNFGLNPEKKMCLSENKRQNYRVVIPFQLHFRKWFLLQIYKSPIKIKKEQDQSKFLHSKLIKKSGAVKNTWKKGPTFFPNSVILSEKHLF